MRSSQQSAIGDQPVHPGKDKDFCGAWLLPCRRASARRGACEAADSKIGYRNFEGVQAVVAGTGAYASTQPRRAEALLQAVRPALQRLLALLFVATSLAAAPQQFQLNLENLAAKASDSIDLSLSGSTLKFAAKFLDADDPEEGAVKKLIDGLQGIYVRHFEFKQDNEWTAADLDRLRNQLHAPEWQRIIGVKESDSSENSEVYIHQEGGKMNGVAILTSAPREVTVINIVGPIDLDQLVELGGHFDIPKLTVPKDKKSK